MAPRPSSTDFSRKLARPVKVRRGPTLKTLRDVRAFVLALPEERQHSETWAAVAAELLQAAENGDVAGVTRTIELVLYLEGRWEKQIGGND